jgi:hypothetical protein
MYVLIPDRIRHIPEQLKLARTPPFLFHHPVSRDSPLSISRRRVSSFIC